MPLFELVRAPRGSLSAAPGAREQASLDKASSLTLVIIATVASFADATRGLRGPYALYAIAALTLIIDLGVEAFFRNA